MRYFSVLISCVAFCLGLCALWHSILYLQYFSYHMFLLTVWNQFMAFCICQDICVTIACHQSCESQQKFSHPIHISSHVITWGFIKKNILFFPQSLKFLYPKHAGVLQRRRMIGSVQSEFHRMLVSSKNISQSRNVATVHLTSPCIFTTYILYIKNKL